ncbi:tapasin-related protein-like [Lepisosteus oculatus]|uniref:tapasin-related protein-like n=1 Tax=Lepisosteus oculatus TaxID=7918 RepID=UPI003716240D
MGQVRVSQFCTFLHIVIFLMALSPGHGQALTVLQSLREIKENRGGTVILPCSFEDPDGKADPSTKCAVQWYKAKHGQSLSESTQVPLRTRHALAQPEPSLTHREASLVITNLTLEDAGMYYCTVNVWQRGNGTGAGTELHIHSPPSAPKLFLQMPSNPATEKWSLVCQTKGFHPSHIIVRWSRSWDLHGGVNENLGSSENSPVHTASLKKHMGDHSTFFENGIDEVHSTAVQTLHLFENSSKEDYVISHLQVAHPNMTGGTYLCTIYHVSLEAPLTAEFKWDLFEAHLPFQATGCLNVFKICFLGGLFCIFFAAALKSCCENRLQYFGSSRK